MQKIIRKWISILLVCTIAVLFLPVSVFPAVAAAGPGEELESPEEPERLPEDMDTALEGITLVSAEGFGDDSQTSDAVDAIADVESPEAILTDADTGIYAQLVDDTLTFYASPPSGSYWTVGNYDSEHPTP